MELTILFADDDLLAVEKPAGLLSVPGRGPDKADCAVSRAAAGFGWVREVHRLDQATSGILILARNPESHRSLSIAFQERKVEKTYEAITAALPGNPHIPGVEYLPVEPASGNPAADGGEIRLFQRLDPENRPMQVVVSDGSGKEAVTRWSLAAGGGEPGLILHPLTGRTHQLRLAMAVCGAPILGDRLYAPEPAASAAGRLMLHASWIRFPHPVSGEMMELFSESGLQSR